MGGLSLSVFALLKMKTETMKDLGINSFAITVISLKDVFWGNDLSPAARRGPCLPVRDSARGGFLETAGPPQRLPPVCRNMLFCWKREKKIRPHTGGEQGSRGAVLTAFTAIAMGLDAAASLRLRAKWEPRGPSPSL